MVFTGFTVIKVKNSKRPHRLKNATCITRGDPKLNDKVFNPAILERVNVTLADAVFHSSTIKTLFYYSRRLCSFYSFAVFWHGNIII